LSFSLVKEDTEALLAREEIRRAPTRSLGLAVQRHCCLDEKCSPREKMTATGNSANRRSYTRNCLTLLWLTTLFLTLGMALGAQAPAISEAPEDVYRGELVTYPGAWGFEIQHPGIILVRDDELGTLASDPDKVINLSTGTTPWEQSLRQICERARAHGQRTLTIAFDQFFAQ